MPKRGNRATRLHLPAIWCRGLSQRFECPQSRRRLGRPLFLSLNPLSSGGTANSSRRPLAVITGVRQSKQTRHTYALDSLVSNMPNFVLGAESQSRDSLSCRWVPRLQSRHLPSVSANQRHPSGTSKLPPGHPQPILLLVPLLLVICRRQARGGTHQAKWAGIWWQQWRRRADARGGPPTIGDRRLASGTPFCGVACMRGSCCRWEMICTCGQQRTAGA